jgi:hypothetical protein
MVRTLPTVSSGPRRNCEVLRGIPPKLRRLDSNSKVIYHPDHAMNQKELSHTGAHVVGGLDTTRIELAARA